MSARLLVTGGSGLIGAEVCRVAVEGGREVVAVARGGRPRDVDAAWAERVRWVAADVLEPAAWRGQLAGCAAVVHCVGIVREHRRAGVTFERANGDAALVAAREAEAAGVPRFVFLSAAAKPPLVDEGYLVAKRRAERALLEGGLRVTILRPGLVVGARRPVSYLAARLIRAGLLVPGVRHWAEPGRPLPVEVVARCAVRAALEPEIGGILYTDDIERLGAG